MYVAAFGGAVAWASGTAGRPAVLWLAGLGLVLSRGPLIAPAAIALLAGFGWSFQRRPERVVGVAVGAVSVQVVLRWPPTGAHGLTAVLAAVAVLPVLVHGVHVGVSRRGRVWLMAIGGLLVVLAVLAGPVAVQALRSRSAIDRSASLTQSALSSVRQGDASAASGQLAEATAGFGAAHARLDDWWTAGADLVPVAAQQRRALVTATSVAGAVTRTVGAEAGDIDVSGLHYRNGTVDLAQVEALGPPLATVQAALASAGRRVRGVRSGWLLPPVRSRLGRLDQQLRSASSSDSVVEEAVADAPSLLGADGTRHYLIALLDTSESRGLGGLLVWYGNVTASDGHVVLSSYGNAVGIGTELQAAGGGHLDGPADYLARYGIFHPQDTFIDATYSPDLPTVTDVVSQLYHEAGNPPIDGMLVLDPRSLAAVFAFTGPIAVPGFGLVDAANAAELLEKGEYALYPDPDDQAARRAALSQLIGDASRRLTSGGGPGLKSLVQTLAPQVRTGDLMFWSVHPADQPLLQRVGLSGKFPSSRGGDLLSVTTQNSANNKIDAYLHRRISDEVTYSPGRGDVSATVSVDLTNTAPASGLSYLVIDSYEGSGLPPGTNLTWLTIYSPLRLVAGNLDGKAVGFSEGTELGVNAYSTYVQVGPGASRDLTVQLQGRIPASNGYSLAMYQQPMINPDQVSVSVTDSGDPARRVVWSPPHDVDVFRFFPSAGR